MFIFRQLHICLIGFLLTGTCSGSTGSMLQSEGHCCLAPSHSDEDLSLVMELAEKISWPYIPVWKVTESEENIQVTIVLKCREKVCLHWGNSTDGVWQEPAESIWPEKTTKADHAARTPFMSVSEDIRVCSVTIPKSMDFDVLEFVLFYPDKPPAYQWGKNLHQNYKIPVKREPAWALLDEPTRNLIETLIKREENPLLNWPHSLPNDFIRSLLENPSPFSEYESLLSTLAVYLRYLSLGFSIQGNRFMPPIRGAQSLDSLCSAIVKWIQDQPRHYSLLRLMMSYLSEGGNGNRIRDGINAIFENHDLNPGLYTCLFDWRIKLHNESTPDDIVICEAYLAFLKSNGDLDVYYRVLWDRGIAKVSPGVLDGLYGQARENKKREIITTRLLSYRNPIRNEPLFFSDRKDVLIRDLEAYLELLKQIHSRADLYRSRTNMGKYPHIPGGLNDALNDFFTFKDQVEHTLVEQGWVKLLERLTTLRRMIREEILNNGKWPYTRDLVSLDLSLEEYSGTISQNISEYTDPQEITPDAAENLSLQLENILLSFNEEDADIPEILMIRKEWDKLQEARHKDPSWHLHAKSVLDRLQRVIGDRIQRETDLFQPKAQVLGNNILKPPDRWAVPIFSEEMIRSSPLFTLANLLTPLRKAAREKALLPPYDVIVPGKVTAQVRKADTLKEILTGLKEGDRIIAVVKQLDGTEDIPPQIAGIISQREVDITSHLSLRARNLKVPFMCVDSEEGFHALFQNDRPLMLHVAEGMTRPWQVYTGDLNKVSTPAQIPAIDLPPVDQSGEPVVLAMEEFTPEKTGPKAFHLKHLRKETGDKIRIPESIDVPYGVFNKVLEANQDMASKIKSIIGKIDKEQNRNTVLPLLKEVQEHIQHLKIPPMILDPIITKITEKIQTEGALMFRSSASGEDLEKFAGAGLYDSFFNVYPDQAEEYIKKVWASKWTERAYWTRRDLHIPHDEIDVSVLIQEMFNFDYSFVVHTENPVSNDPDEVYIEIAQGLGEAIVSGAYPGTAYRFLYNKNTREVRRISFASKSRKLIVQDKKLKRVLTDYTDDFLAGPQEQWTSLIRSIGEAGCLIQEKQRDRPQDIEGGFFLNTHGGFDKHTDQVCVVQT
ncbi:MAG: hypothetical protein JW774_06910, partial [Candidatus Aureabacteria bacterium]|nr:hypothetical protein [Candidatus Auribacterota bacterium]